MCVFFCLDATTSTLNHVHNSKTETEERERKPPKKVIAQIVIYTAVFDVTHIITVVRMHEPRYFILFHILNRLGKDLNYFLFKMCLW